MSYNEVHSKVCEMKSNQVALGVLYAASKSMNNGQLAILETSGKVTSRARVSTTKIESPFFLFPDYYSSDLEYSTTEVTAKYDEPFGDLFHKANETAERYAQIAFNSDFLAYTRQGAINEVLSNFREAEKYVDRRIGIFI